MKAVFYLRPGRDRWLTAPLDPPAERQDICDYPRLVPFPISKSEGILRLVLLISKQC